MYWVNSCFYITRIRRFTFEIGFDIKNAPSGHRAHTNQAEHASLRLTWSRSSIWVAANCAVSPLVFRHWLATISWFEWQLPLAHFGHVSTLFLEQNANLTHIEHVHTTFTHRHTHHRSIFRLFDVFGQRRTQTMSACELELKLDSISFFKLIVYPKKMGLPVWPGFTRNYRVTCLVRVAFNLLSKGLF